MASIRSSLLLLTLLLFVNKQVVNSTESLTFSFTEFVPQQPDLIFQGDALVPSTGKLQLTQMVQASMGRALYSAPVHIWDRKTGNVANFITSFSFIINSANTFKIADGFAFFLAPVDTRPQSSGGLLGLFPNQDESKSYQVVAVEFDIFSNPWDPQGLHIGVDVNGIRSVKTTPWALENGQVANVVITYQASTKLLTAFLTYPSTQTSYVISSVVDIKNVLPEYVRVGFSAAKGLSEDYGQFSLSYDVLSWSFESKLPSGTKGAALNNVNVSSYGFHSSI